jgi:hypothetical protein
VRRALQGVPAALLSQLRGAQRLLVSFSNGHDSQRALAN